VAASPASRGLGPPRSRLSVDPIPALFQPFQTLSGLLMTSTPPPKDDSFELYDLRVEAVVPPGKRIMCGAREGDHFTLQGEMLHLPAGQGFSIYSLGTPLERSSTEHSVKIASQPRLK